MKVPIITNDQQAYDVRQRTRSLIKATLESLSNSGVDNISPDLKMDNLVLCLKDHEAELGGLSISRFGRSADHEMHHAVCCARKELEASLLNLRHCIDSLKMLTR